MPNEPNLNEDFIAFGKAQEDVEFTLFKIYTRPMKNGGESGQYALDATYPLSQFEKFPDPVGLLKYITRAYLLNCIDKTKVPMDQWIIEYSPIMERYQVPSHLFLDTQRDRTWLL
jgi:hypothetical protein